MVFLLYGIFFFPQNNLTLAFTSNKINRLKDGGRRQNAEG